MHGNADVRIKADATEMLGLYSMLRHFIELSADGLAAFGVASADFIV